MNKKAYLCLEDGTLFQGKSFGAEGTVVAKLIFNTAMVGYLETLTDPNCYGQIVLQTFPLIGNYGIIPEDFESAKPTLRGYIVMDPCDHPSNFRGTSTLDTFLKDENVVGLSGIDTRALTKHIREHGIMRAVLTTDPDKATTETIKAASATDFSESFSPKEVQTISSEANGPRVVLWDFGCKKSIEEALLNRGATVIHMPANSTRDDILAQKPDALVLSNGPMNPNDAQSIIDELTKLRQDKLPTFGIALGHQLLALSHGFNISQLKYGHHGGSQPVLDTITNRIYITGQNTSAVVDTDSIDSAIATTRFVNSNDGSCEGIDYINEPCYSVQFYPGACGGPKDTDFLFDRLFEMMEV